MTQTEPAVETANSTIPDLCISTFRNAKDNEPRPYSVCWNDFVNTLSEHDEHPLKDGPCFSPAAYPKGAFRGLANPSKPGYPGPLSICAAVGDFDKGRVALADLKRHIESLGLAYVCHSTHSHTEDKPSYRVIVPLMKPVSADAWREVWQEINERVFLGANDKQTKDASHIYYLPACPPGAVRFTFNAPGLPLDLDTLLAESKADETPPQRELSENGSRASFERAANAFKERKHPFEVGGAPIGEQRTEALAAARTLLNWGCTEQEAIERVWAALQSCVWAPDKAPWRHEDVVQMVQYIRRHDRFPNPPGSRSGSASFDSEGNAVDPSTGEVLGGPKSEEAPADAPTAVAPAWPVLASEALYGLAGEIVEKIEPHTESDPVALLVQLLTMFGSIVGHGPFFMVEATPHFMNLFIVIVATTGSRKGTSFSRIRSIYRQVDTEWTGSRIKTGLSSGEGLVWNVRDPIFKLETDKKTGRSETVETDHGVDDKRLLAIEAEFSTVLACIDRQGSTLSHQIRQAWETGDLQIMTKNSPVEAHGAHISIIGHVTKDELLRRLTATESANGFANRFAFFCTTRSKCLPEGGSLDSGALQPFADRLAEAVEFARTVGEMRRDDDARRLWAEVYPELSEGKPGLYGAITGRAEAQVLRLSCLYSLLDCSAIVRPEHLMAALTLWKYSSESAAYIFGCDSLGDPVADEILCNLKRNPDGMTRTEISKLFQGHQKAESIGRALNLLAEHGKIRSRIEGTEGRSAEIWTAM